MNADEIAYRRELAAAFRQAVEAMINAIPSPKSREADLDFSDLVGAAFKHEHKNNNQK